MASKMNNKTHKVIVAEYTTRQFFAVPIDWKVEDCSVKYDNLYHFKDDCVEGVFQAEIDYKYPDDVVESDMELSDYDMYFDCEEEEESD